MKKEDATKRVDDAISAGAAKSEIEQLASLSRIEYDWQRKEEAKKLGIKLDTLDREVGKLRAKQEAADNPLPHWNVEPCSDPDDGAPSKSWLKASPYPTDRHICARNNHRQ